MSFSGRQIHDSTAIDGILRGLTNRPNVQSTLILSRKDGSIIRATGFKDAQDSSILSRQSYAAVETPTSARSEQDKSYANLGSPSSGGKSIVMTEVEQLANHIHTFVTVSAVLAGSMSGSGSGSTAELSHGRMTDDATQMEGEKKGGLHTGLAADQDVQLLRMRTRKQEIIIFPDQNYLCCVIQNISKGKLDAKVQLS